MIESLFIAVNCSNKHTNAGECEKWAAEGECQINRVWMPENCRKSCHMCGKSVVVITTTHEPDYSRLKSVSLYP
ncbi:hypothetical protein DPMN_133834 [Dreissena polymorpha]|uniref:ShKT domain-containing protein n=1 Tax=Dreissena polymorpha TaxID=45954 RepID=A0A9D4FZ18_DREPO|nr:hypothetical protein DPMN_133834 [Dreissena polymorpha]